MTDLNKRVSQYVALRDRIKDLEAKHKEELKPFKEMLDTLNSSLLAALDEQNSESVRTESGTVYRTPRVSASIADADAFWNYVQDNKAWDLLDRRANKTAVTDYVDEHNAAPPGINYSVTHVVGVRRA